ncbi:MAG: TetR family transcriptional regulator [Streptosporangiales bacterium]|nr:TetR family transcriptional regulator [Streptosporangiales bacterium]
MPRVANHGLRRRQVAEALLRVVAEGGLDAASLPRVAAEAGTSVGLIQRYFRSKDDLLEFAFDHLYSRTLERLAAVGPADSVREGLARGLAVLLPLDEERVREGRMLLAYMARASVNPRLARPHIEGTLEIRRLTAAALRQAERDGEVAPGIDPEREAIALAAYVDGLAVHMLSAPGSLTPSTARSLLDSYLNRLFTGRSHG